jgi:hypothetical protein
MDVEPRRLDVFEQLMLRDTPWCDGRNHVPVAEVEVAVGDGQRPAALQMDDAAAPRMTGVLFGAEMSIPNGTPATPEMRGSLKYFAHRVRLSNSQRPRYAPRIALNGHCCSPRAVEHARRARPCSAVSSGNLPRHDVPSPDWNLRNEPRSFV